MILKSKIPKRNKKTISFINKNSKINFEGKNHLKTINKGRNNINYNINNNSFAYFINQSLFNKNKKNNYGKKIILSNNHLRRN